jgi:hypothetical protein
LSLKIDDILSCYEGGVNTFWENKAENGQADRMMTRTLYRYGKTLCTDTAKRFCLTNERNSTILILTGAPSPSGKAGDFDSPIVGSTPAGATEKEPVGGLGDRFHAGFLFCEKRVFV